MSRTAIKGLGCEGLFHAPQRLTDTKSQPLTMSEKNAQRARQGEAVAAEVVSQDAAGRGYASLCVPSVLGADEESGCGRCIHARQRRTGPTRRTVWGCRVECLSNHSVGRSDRYFRGWPQLLLLVLRLRCQAAARTRPNQKVERWKYDAGLVRGHSPGLSVAGRA